jgi:hypothetical protein
MGTREEEIYVDDNSFLWEQEREWADLVNTELVRTMLDSQDVARIMSREWLQQKVRSMYEWAGDDDVSGWSNFFRGMLVAIPHMAGSAASLLLEPDDLDLESIQVTSVMHAVPEEDMRANLENDKATTMLVTYNIPDAGTGFFSDQVVGEIPGTEGTMQVVYSPNYGFASMEKYKDSPDGFASLYAAGETFTTGNEESPGILLNGVDRTDSTKLKPGQQLHFGAGYDIVRQFTRDYIDANTTNSAFAEDFKSLVDQTGNPYAAMAMFSFGPEVAPLPPQVDENGMVIGLPENRTWMELNALERLYQGGEAHGTNTAMRLLESELMLQGPSETFMGIKDDLLLDQAEQPEIDPRDAAIQQLLDILENFSQGSGRTYEKPDRREVRDMVRGTLGGLVGNTYTPQELEHYTDVYMADHYTAWSQPGLGLSPRASVMELIRGRADYQNIHRLRPEGVDEENWLTAYQSQARNLVGATMQDQFAQNQAAVGGAMDRLDEAAANVQFATTSTKRPALFNKFERQAGNFFRMVR